MGCCNSKVQPDVEEPNKDDADSYQDEASTIDGQQAGQNVFRVLGMGEFTPDGFVPHVDGHALSPEEAALLNKGLQADGFTQTEADRQDMAVGSSLPNLIAPKDAGVGSSAAFEPNHMAVGDSQPSLFPMDAAVGSSLPGGGVDRSIGMGNDTLRGMGAFGGVDVGVGLSVDADVLMATMGASAAGSSLLYAGMALANADAMAEEGSLADSQRIGGALVTAAYANLRASVRDSIGKETKTVTSETAVKVAVVVRPLADIENGCKDVVTVIPPGRITLPKKAVGGIGESYPFEFDKVIKVECADDSKHGVFGLVTPVMERFCQGFNGTVLAYGQTGSGKTYTMGTSCSESDFLAPEPRGVVPRALMVLFSYIGMAQEAYDVSLKVQYVEIYNECVIDLLADVNEPKAALQAQKNLDIRERPTGEVFVEGAAEIFVVSREQVARVLNRGNANRTTAAHRMNSESSRSHAIVTLVLEQRAKPSMQDQVPEELRFLRSKLHLVDLAGSERVKDTGATGERFSEGVNINQGLLQLGNVVNALSEGKRRNHVPYRNSKLTRLLSDSLGGNSETLFLACISPADRNHEQTLNTLRYASRARAIRNRLRLNNKMGVDEELEYLRGLVRDLQNENSQLKRKMDAAGVEY